MAPWWSRKDFWGFLLNLFFSSKFPLPLRGGTRNDIIITALEISENTWNSRNYTFIMYLDYMLTTIVQVCGLGHVYPLWPSIQGIPIVIIHFNWCFINGNFSLSGVNVSQSDVTWYGREHGEAVANRTWRFTCPGERVLDIRKQDNDYTMYICAIFSFSSTPQTTNGYHKPLDKYLFFAFASHNIYFPCFLVFVFVLGCKQIYNSNCIQQFNYGTRGEG